MSDSRQDRRYFLAQVNSDYDYEKDSYCPPRWEKSVGNALPSEVRKGDLIVIYFGGLGLEYKKQIGLVFEVVRLEHHGLCFRLNVYKRFDPPLGLNDIRDLVDTGILGRVFGKCGTQGFNMCRISGEDFDSLMKVASEPLQIAADRVEMDGTSPVRINATIVRFVRDTALTKILKSLDSNKCQICGNRLLVKDGYYPEAHHIQPLGKQHHGTDAIGNIIILCPNHHVEFDYGTIAVDPENLTVVHRDSTERINGRKITLRLKHGLDRRYLFYHLNIFGK